MEKVKSKGKVIEISYLHRISFKVPDTLNTFHTVEYKEVRDVRGLTNKEVKQERKLLIDKVLQVVDSEVQETIMQYETDN